MDDRLEIYVYPQPKRFACCPYEITKRLVNKCSAPDHFLAPWKNDRSVPKNYFSTWFRTMRYEFQAWVKNSRGWDAKVVDWTPSVMRTSYVGLLKTEGFDWDIICAHTGHSLGSSIKQKVYLTNVVTTGGFDLTLGRQMRHNKKLKNLMRSFEIKVDKNTLAPPKIFVNKSPELTPDTESPIDFSDCMSDTEIYSSPASSVYMDSSASEAGSIQPGSRSSSPVGFLARYRKQNKPYSIN